MDIKKQIKSSLNQAEIYKSQGLMKEARDKYAEAGRLLQKHQKLISNYRELLGTVAGKLKQVKEQILAEENAPVTMEMSHNVQEIIRTRLAFSDDGMPDGDNPDDTAFKGAVALVRFGQYSRALEEFRNLLSGNEFRLDAAKNIIRCHVALDTVREAVIQYQNWHSGNLFTSEELQQIRSLLQDILDKKDIGVKLPPVPPPGKAQDVDAPDFPAEDGGGFQSGQSEEVLIDISSVGIVVPQGEEQKPREYDVSFQSGNMLNLLISDRDQGFLDLLEPGRVMGQIQFYSPIAMFEGEAVIISKSRIESGPKAGHYSIDIKIKSI